MTSVLDLLYLQELGLNEVHIFEKWKSYIMTSNLVSSFNAASWKYRFLCLPHSGDQLSQSC